jgi:hypothetical protein
MQLIEYYDFEYVCLVPDFLEGGENRREKKQHQRGVVK